MIRRILYIVALGILSPTFLFAQAAGDFRTNGVGGGNWNLITTWQTFDGSVWNAAVATPTDTDGVITILSGDAVTVTASVNVDQTTVDAGGSVTINSGQTLQANAGAGDDLTINGTLTNNGTLAIQNAFPPPPPKVGKVVVNGTFNNGGTVSNATTSSLVYNAGAIYDHQQDGGVIPTATWDTTADCRITGITTTVPTGLGQSFGNFTWNCTSQSGYIPLTGTLTSVANDLTFSSTNGQAIYLTETNNYTLSVGGDFIISGSYIGLNSTATVTANVVGDFIVSSSSTIDFALGGTSTTLDVNGAFSTSGTSALNITYGTASDVIINVAGDFTVASTTIGNAGGSGTYTLTFDGVDVVQNFSSDAAITDFDIVVATAAILDLGTSSIKSASSAETFTLNNGGTLRLGSVHASGALQTVTTAGNMRIVNASRTYAAGSNIIYNGASAQFLGNAFPTDVDLEIDNSAGVSLSGATTIAAVRTLTLTSGSLTIGDANTLTIDGTVTATSGDVAAGNTSNLSIGGSGAFGTIPFASGTNSLNNFTLNRTTSGSIVLGSDLTVVGTLTQTNGNIELNGNALIINGPFVQSAGSIVGSATSTLSIGGSGALPGSTSFSSDPLGTLTLDRNGATFATGAGFTVTNLNLYDGILNNTSTITIDATSGLVTRRAGGSVSNALGASPSYDLRYDISSSVSSGPELPTSTTALDDLTKIGSGTVTLATNTTVNGVLTLTAGTLNAGSTTLTLEGNFVSNATATLTSATLVFDGTTALSGATNPVFGSFTVNSGASFTPNSSLTVNGNIVNNGTLNSGSATVTFAGTTTISGSATSSFNNVIISGTLNGPTLMNVAGTWTNNGTFNRGSGTVAFTGTSSIAGSSTTTFNDITITGTLNAPSTLFLADDLTNNGTFVHNDGLVHFNGSSGTQVVSGSSTTAFFDVLAENLTRLDNATTLEGILTLGASTTFNANGNFTLLSTASGTAGIATIPSGSSVTNNVNYQRYLENLPSAHWRHIGIPLTGSTVTISELQDDFAITGGFTGASTGYTSNPSLYYYNEVTAGDVDQGWTEFPTTSNTETLTNYRGYAAYIRTAFLGATIDATGTIIQGNVDFGVTYTDDAGQPATEDGWNLLANPYPSAIDWDLLTANGSVNGSVAVFDADGAGYIYWNGTTGGLTDGIIASGQAFWAQTNAAGPSLTATEASKVNNRTVNLFRVEETVNDLLEVTLMDDNVSDKTYIHFREGATEDFDNQYDARKLQNDKFNLSTLMPNGDNLAINSLPNVLNDCYYTTSLNITNIDPGSYTLDFQGFDSFGIALDIVLVDSLTGNQIRLSESSTYQFSITADPNSFGGERFTLVFELDVQVDISQSDNVLMSSSETGNQWYVDGDAIDGATGQTYEVTESGTYYVEVTKGDCVVISDDVELSITGTLLGLIDSIEIYPNPVTDVLTIRVPSEISKQSLTATLWNVNGKLLISQRFDGLSDELTIEFGTYKGGVYILKLASESDSHQFRIIKE